MPKRNGAMGRGPKKTQNPDRIQRRIDYLSKRDPNDPRLSDLRSRLEAAGGEVAETPFAEMSPQQQIGQIQTGAGENIQNYLAALQQQGAFQPGAYEDTYQQAYQNIMGQFESQTAPEFARQNEAMEAAIAQRGLDPTGAQAQRLREQLYQNQSQARQQAMYQAEQMGRGLQQQRFQQDLTQYQVPTAQLQALQGYYTGQLGSIEAQKQREFEKQQLAQQLAARGGSPDPFALMAAEYGYKRDLIYDAAAAEGENQQQRPSAGGAFLTGIGQGIGAGVTSSLMS